ncbi:MAG: mRNA splicing protein prp18 [Peltula sp. TS41687]|nr:MAG: mRNA splicing protein prp18 [Peltula sp. TS41687]
MDFAALMSSEIAKAKPSPSSSSSTAGGQYLKRAELEKRREAAYLVEKEALRATKEEKALKKRKLEEEAAERTRVIEQKRARLAEDSRKRRLEEEARTESARRKRLGLPDAPLTEEEKPTPGDPEDLDDAELALRLRQLGEPVQLFGETRKQKLRRYKHLVAQPTTTLTTLELLPEESTKVDTVPTDGEGKRYLYRQLASYFTMVLREWESALEARPTEIKESFQGKAASKAFLQSKENMKPLFRKFEKGDLDILDAVVEIVKATQERRYVDANDAYLRLSIGKAAWPIGVTMVGIHERSAREKLHESEAHIMSDEVTRKFLQSIKRCISFVQTRWPPWDQGQLMG